MRHVPEPKGRRGRRRPPTYYGVPPIRMSHWKWLIVSYFFLGGLSAGSYIVATLAELLGGREDRDTVRAGRYVSLLAILPCPALLILDLGRPERFLNMLRVVKFRSPMSIGTWGLLAFSGFSTLSAAAQARRDGVLPFPATTGYWRAPAGLLARSLQAAPTRLVGLLGAPLGFFIGGYTGVLLGATAVPVWAKNARLLGPLFLSSALAVGCSAISLVLALLPGGRREALERLHRAETVAAAGELLAMTAIHLNSGRIGRPLTEGRLGRLHMVGSFGLGIALPTLLHTLGPRIGLPYRLIVAASSIASLIGGFVVKYAVVMAGHASADDPAATFEFADGEQRVLPDDRPSSAVHRP